MHTDAHHDAVAHPEIPARKLIRYGNRKLYDPVLHGYVNFADLMRMVEENEPFEIKSNKDGTMHTAQILAGMLAQMARDGMIVDNRRFAAFIREAKIAHKASLPKAAT